MGQKNESQSSWKKHEREWKSLKRVDKDNDANKINNFFFDTVHGHGNQFLTE